ncbi:MAG: type II toxin-antitoxin system VapC family toxin [Salinibacterium sp.]|nr:type II toxin-antitoxin system VapC family toxin [Salinibacterium sp.]
MIIDSSALVSVLLAEPDASRYAAALSQPGPRRLSAGTLLEVSIVIDGRRNPLLSARLDELIREARATIEPVTANQAALARQAYRDFGRGSGHPANLNFGDCFAYALAKDLGEPLLYKGDNFVHTDIRSALDT